MSSHKELQFIGYSEALPALLEELLNLREIMPDEGTYEWAQIGLNQTIAITMTRIIEGSIKLRLMSKLFGEPVQSNVPLSRDRASLDENEKRRFNKIQGSSWSALSKEFRKLSHGDIHPFVNLLFIMRDVSSAHAGVIAVERDAREISFCDRQVNKLWSELNSSDVKLHIPEDLPVDALSVYSVHSLFRRNVVDRLICDALFWMHEVDLLSAGFTVCPSVRELIEQTDRSHSSKAALIAALNLDF